jgi:hypothetical protein
MMNIMAVLMIAALLGVVGSLVMGLTAMTRDGVAAHRTSEQWMTMRVVFQGLALALVLVTLLN